MAGVTVSETTGSEAMAMNLPGADPSAENARQSAVIGTLAEPGPAERSAVDETVADGDAIVEIEIEELPVIIPPPAPTGFQAILQHANLHNLLQIESLSRTTGVFLVISQGRTGYLHLSRGQLTHAECGPLMGEGAAAEILSWGEGEFKSCSRPLAAQTTIHISLQALLLRLAHDTDEAAQSERRGPLSAAQPIEEDRPTEPHLPALNANGQSRSSAAPPRSSRLPPPLPPRIERESASVAEVLISPSGELVHGRGIGPDEFSARVAYAARLADLIGRAIRSGTPRALELKGKGTQTTVKWQPDGGLSATLELVQSQKTR